MARLHTALFAAIAKCPPENYCTSNCRRNGCSHEIECSFCEAIVPEQGTVYYKDIEMVACGSCQDRNDYEAELNREAFLEMQAENS